MADIANPSAAVSESVNRLGISLLQALSQKNGGNVFISPFSLATALAMLHSGARGETRKEMRKVLGYEDAGIQDEKVAEAFSGLLSSLDNSSDSYVLSCANSLVAQQDFAVKDEYKGLLTESFRASLFLADFKNDSEKAVADINKWVGEKTNGMIPTLLNSLDSNTVMVLLNAIYFKGTWQNTFDEEATRLQDFYNGGSKSNAKKVHMMHKKDRYGYAERDSFTLLHLPYVGKNIAMMVLLPRFMDGLSALEKQLTTKFLEELRKEMRPIKVNVSLPKFKIEYSKSLVGTLQDLGMKSAFEAADLGGMSCCQDLYVSDVFHKAVVEVNEEGSEAAAATAVMIGLRCMPLPEVVPDFVVDHPFLFAIVDMKSNATLFLGRIDEL